jgi:hypothetical protein
MLNLLLISSATIGVAFGLVCVLANAISGYEFTQHYSTLATTAFGMAALGAYVAFVRGAWRWPMIATLTVSVGGICVGLIDIFAETRYFCFPLFRLSYVLFPAAIILAWLGLLSLAQLNGWHGWLRFAVQVCVLLLVLLPVAAWFWDVTNQFDLEAGVALLLGGVGLGSLAVIGTIIVTALGWLERKKGSAKGGTTEGPDNNPGSPGGP